MTNYEIANIIIGCINLVFLFISTISILLLYKQVKIEYDNYDANREEKVRAKTVEVIHTWTCELKKESRLVEELVESFDEKICKNIYNCKSFTVDKKTFNLILQICFFERLDMLNNDYIEKNYKTHDNKYKVDGFVLTELRWHITSYLNSLEVVAISWQQGLIDKEVLFDQFSFLIANGRNTMERYRKIAGNGNSYPAIEAFCKAMRKSREPKHDSALPKDDLRRKKNNLLIFNVLY